MQQNWNARARLMAGAALVAAAGLASGCMGSPTYGTNKTANAHLMSDLGGIFSFAPKKRQPIDYTPRPELVKPPKNEGALPPPQENAITNNASWPESPEQRVARIRAEADANADNPNYRSPIIPDVALAAPIPASVNQHGLDSGTSNPSATSAQRAAFNERLKEQQQGSSTRRKYLSEPPLEYRQASAAAPQGQIGEDEAAKERRLKREARKKSGRGFNLDDLNPF